VHTLVLTFSYYIHACAFWLDLLQHPSAAQQDIKSKWMTGSGRAAQGERRKKACLVVTPRKRLHVVTAN
jgi:hypothetical protein